MGTRLDDLYAALEVQPNADIAAVKKSYRTLVLKYHPDKNPEDPEAAQAKIRVINAAYAILGNPQKRAAHEQHAKGSEILSQRGAATRSFGEYSTASHRRHDVALPTQFMMIPVGNCDKFLRNVNRSFVFHSREDAKATSFAEFFATAALAIHWLPDANNPDRKAKFGGQCRLQSQPSQDSEGKIVGSPGWLSFALQGAQSSDVMLSPIATGLSSPDLTDLILLPSPLITGAFRFESAFSPGVFLSFDPPSGCAMTTLADQFAVFDFVVEDVQTCRQFQTLDEVLLPIVKQHGGDVIYVKLTAICTDPSVRTYFQIGMKCEWDFEDFAFYFLAHAETWDYNSEQQSLRIRKEGEAPKQPPAKRAKVTVPTGPPTKVLVLANLVGAGDVDSDLEEETADEAKKFGKLTKCTVKEISGVSDEEAVRIFLEFEAKESATKAFDVFNGRIFDGRTVKAWYYDEAVYKEGNLEK